MKLAPQIIVALSCLIGACTEMGPFSDIPKPYQPRSKGTFDTSQMVMSDHIVVMPIEGLNDDRSTQFRVAIAKALGEHDVLATMEAPPMRTSELHGLFSADPTPVISWTLLDPYDRPSQSFSTPFIKTGAALEDRQKQIARSVALQLTGRPPSAAPKSSNRNSCTHVSEA